MKYYALLMAFGLALWQPLWAQNITRKQLSSEKITHSVKVDGVLNETGWQNAAAASDFIQREPVPLQAARFKTTVKVLYDDRAVYIGAEMSDPAPDSILKELTLRDNIGNTDFFVVIFDTYKDGNNGLGFLVTAAGIQADAKYYPSANGEDFTWSAVWDAAVQRTEKGWTAEMMIPYSALRFPNAANQTWRVNFLRQTRRYREMDSWNPIDPKIAGFLTQFGELSGINDIKPPVRLQAMPFVSGYAQNYYDKKATPKQSWGQSFNAGMDVKYGINDAFTLDMTLIPDFGQVQSDNNILNLSPYEVRFDENRQFFTEGVELFNKGGFFYSRRIGSVTPYFIDRMTQRLKEGDVLQSLPSEAQLYNASKVSGRNAKGLGIGVFNATSAPVFAEVKGIDGAVRDENVQPLTNYNVVSFDQNLPYNSYFTLINTNVMRSGDAYDANVTGINFDLKNKANTYHVSGGGGVAQRVFTSDNDVSYKYMLNIGKISGNFTWNLGYNQESRGYNPNDLGFLRSPNESSWNLNLRYTNFKPKQHFNRYSVSANTFYANLQAPYVYNSFNININSFFITKKFLAFGSNLDLNPIATHDYFEPRTTDFSRYWRQPENTLIGGFISTDYRKTFALDVNGGYRWFTERGQNGWDLTVAPRCRVNDKLSFFWAVDWNERHNYINYIAKNSSAVGASAERDVVFGEREQTIITNTPSVKWNFSPTMGLTLRLRHYWTKVAYDRFFRLDNQGDLVTTPYKGVSATGANLHDGNFNISNIDMNFTWRFAPGSDIIVNWKNAINNANTDLANNYFYNARNLFDNPQTNSFSMKVIYFVDYLNVARKKVKKTA